MSTAPRQDGRWPAMVRTRWAAIGAAVAVTLGAGGLVAVQGRIDHRRVRGRDAGAGGRQPVGGRAAGAAGGRAAGAGRRDGPGPGAARRRDDRVEGRGARGRDLDHGERDRRSPDEHGNSLTDEIVVPLGAIAPVALADGDVHFDTAGYADTSTACTGTVAAPTAPEGKVCIYVHFAGGIDPANTAGFAAPVLKNSGFTVVITPDGLAGDDVFLFATWAYQAP